MTDRNVRPTRSPEAVPKVARTKSNGFGTLPKPQPWAGLLALDGRMRVAFPSDNSGTVATTDVHYSGASAAEFHRLPDAPKAMRNIPLLFLNASFIDLVAAEAWVAGAEDWRRLAGQVLRWA